MRPNSKHLPARAPIRCKRRAFLFIFSLTRPLTRPLTLQPTALTTMDTPEPSAPDGDSGIGSGVGVGLSDPYVAQGRRRMLDLVNRLHSTG